MALYSSVYISDVDNLSDARYAAGMGVDLVGFRLDPQNNSSLNPEKFKEISEWISGVKIVGEFGDASPEEIKDALVNYNVDYLLISDASQIHAFTQFGKPLILSISINKEAKRDLASTLNYCSGSVDFFLLESELKKLDETEINFLKSFTLKYPIILGYGVDIDNAKSIADELSLKGISLKGSTEIRPGYKDFDEMADILELLEVE